MNKKLLKLILSILSNILIIIFNIWAITIAATSTHSDLDPSKPFDMFHNFFKFYTIQSNLFLFVASTIYLVAVIISLIKDKLYIKKWMSLLKYYATITTTITFVVVMVFLGPVMNFNSMLFTGFNLHYHVLCPTIGVVTLLCFDTSHHIEFKHTLYNFIPTGIYTIFYIILVFGLHFDDHYMFFKFGPFAAIGIILGIYGACFGLATLYRYIINKR